MLSIAALGALALVSSAQATNYYWDPTGASTAAGGAGTWDTSSPFWTAGSTTGTLGAYGNQTGDAAFFGGTAGIVSAAAGSTYNVNSLNFLTSGYVVNLSMNIGGSNLPAILNLSGTAPTINIGSGQSDTINGTVSGTGGFTLSGGTLTLNNITQTASVGETLASNSVTLANVAGLQVGMGISATNIANGTTVTALGSGAFTISTNATATATQTATFTSLGDSWTGNAFINNGATLAVNTTQATGAEFILNNGATVTTNQALNAANTFYCNTGLSTVTSSVVTNAVLGGNGNVNFSITNSTAVPQGLFGALGGVATFGNNASLRLVANSSGTTTQANPFATIDFANTTANIYTRGGGTAIISFGGLMGTGNNGLGGTNNAGGTEQFTVGSSNQNNTFAGYINNGSTTTSMTKDGTGTWTLTAAGSGVAYTSTGGFSLNGGTVKLDYSSVPTGILAATDPVNFGGGSLLLQGKSTGTTTQTVGNVTVTGSGGAYLTVNPNGGTATNLSMGTLTATAAGGSLNIQPLNATYGTGTANITTTTNKSTDGTYGGRITFGSDWATTTSSASPYTLSAYSGYSAFVGTGAATTADYLLTDSGTVTASESGNSLKITDTQAGQSLSIGTGLTLGLQNGGLLFTGSNDYTISGGSLKSNTATNSDLIIQQLGTGNLTISSTIVNGTGASTLTKAGPGVLTLSGANTYTGVNNLNAGTVSISADSNLGAIATGAAVNMNGGTLQATATLTLDNAGANKRNVVIFGGGGTIDVTGSNVFTIDGVVSTFTATQAGPLIKTDTGTLVLSGANTYVGATIISGGILQVASLANGGSSSPIGAAINAGPSLVLDGGTLQYNGAGSTTNRMFTVTQNSGTIDSSGSGALVLSNVLAESLTGSGNRTLTLTGSNTNANTYAGQLNDASVVPGLTGVTSLIKSGAGSWTLSGINYYTGTTSVTGGTLLLSHPTSNNPVASSATISVGTGATLDVTNLPGANITLAGSQNLTGLGTVNGAVTTVSGSTITPGTAGAGTLTVGNLNVGANSNFVFGLSSANLDGALTGSANLLSIGNLTLPVSGTATVQLYQPGTSTAFSAPGTYDLFASTGNLSSLASAIASDFTVGSLTANPADTYTFGVNGNYLTLNIVQNGVAGSWSNASGGSWDAINTGNWVAGQVPLVAGDSATFSNLGSGAITVTLDQAVSVAGMTFSNPSGYTINNASTGVLTFDGKGKGATVSVASGANVISAPVNLNDSTSVVVASGTSLAFNGVVGNATATPQVLSLSGGGTVFLGAANTYGPAAGIVGTYLGSGTTVQVGTSTSLGAGDVAVLSSSTLQSGAAGLSLANNIIISSGATATVDTQANTMTLSGLISETAASGSLTKVGTGTLILTSNETYSGATNISGGTLQLGNGGTTGSVAGNIVDNGILSLNRTTDYTLGGLISGSGNLVQTGTNNVTLTAANTFAGSTNISSGSINLGNTLALQNSTLNYSFAGNLSFGSLTAATLGGLSGSKNLALTNTASAAVALTVGNNGASTSYSGVLSGTGASINKVGAGTLTLTGSNTYTGNTSSNGGLLVLGTNGVINGAGIFPAAGNIQVNGGNLSAGATSNVTQGFNFTLTSGSAAFNAGITTSSAGGDGAGILINGGTFTATTVSLERTAQVGNPTAAFLPGGTVPQTSGFVVTGGTATVGTLNLGDGSAATNSATTGYVGGTGTLNVTGQLVVGWEQNTRWNYLQVAGGTLNALGNTSSGGIAIGKAGTAIASELYLTGGTTNAGIVTFGTAADTQGGTANLVINGGTLYVGSGGIVKASTLAGLVDNTVLTTGTLGALADWSSSEAINLNSGGFTIKAADAASVAHNITLSGVLSGTGAPIKTGAGTLFLNGSGNTYTGVTNVSGGTLNINSEYALGGANYSGLILNGGTLQYASSLLNAVTDISTKPVTILGASTIDTNGNTINFANSIGNGGSGGLTKAGLGQLNMSGGSYSGPTTVSGGTLALVTANALPTGTNLTIGSGASLVAENLGTAVAVSVGSLSVLGQLDLNNNALIVHNSSQTAVRGLVTSGYNSGAWNGATGIISSAAANDPAKLTALGILVNDNGSSQPFYGTGGTIASTFAGAVPVDGDVLVKYTYYGDTNLDGMVDGSDYARIDNGFLNSLTGWSNGDFNYDGVVNGSDYTLIDNAFNSQGAQIAAQIAAPTALIAGSGGSSVPEPTTLGLLGIGAVGLLGRRRRR